MEYLDNLYTRLVEKCSVVSPSGWSVTVDNLDLTIDNTFIPVDSEVITSDQTIYI